MLVRRGLPGRDDRGVTLTEMMIVIVVLGIITVPLGDAVITFLRNSDWVGQRLSVSHDAQIAAAYFAQDVQSIGTRDWSAATFPLTQSIELNAPATGGLYPCGPSGTPNAVVRFAWDDPTNATDVPGVVRVAYVVVTSGGERQLVRLTCSGSSTPTSTVVLAHNVDPSFTPDVDCASPSSCASAPAVPQYVTLTLQLRDPANSSAFTVTLTGQRRQT
jgi:prepilin-type N-terminal cleavage/methylation domain-containing protein